MLLLNEFLLLFRYRLSSETFGYTLVYLASTYSILKFNFTFRLRHLSSHSGNKSCIHDVLMERQLVYYCAMPGVRGLA
jgi:hypothetical protein